MSIKGYILDVALLSCDYLIEMYKFPSAFGNIFLLIYATHNTARVTIILLTTTEKWQIGCHWPPGIQLVAAFTTYISSVTTKHLKRKLRKCVSGDFYIIPSLVLNNYWLRSIIYKMDSLGHNDFIIGCSRNSFLPLIRPQYSGWTLSSHQAFSSHFPRLPVRISMNCTI